MKAAVGGRAIGILDGRLAAAGVYDRARNCWKISSFSRRVDGVCSAYTQRTMPALSIRMYARFEKNLSSMRVPYLPAHLPLEVAQQVEREPFLGLELVERRHRIHTDRQNHRVHATKLLESLLNAPISFVQVLVNARGKNASSTFLPRRPESVTSVPAVDGRVKSGAGAPTTGREAIYFFAAAYRFPTSVQFTTFHQAASSRAGDSGT